MALSIYADAAGRHYWAEATSPITLRHLATGQWTLFDDTPDTPPPPGDPFDVKMAAVARDSSSGFAKEQRATFIAEVDSGDFTPTGAWDWTGATVSGLSGGGTVPDASTTVKGIVELATNAETTTGTDTTRAVTPAGLKTVIGALPTGDVGPQGAPGLVWRGAYSGATTYATNDAVSYSGRAFIALQGSTGATPPTTATSTAYWGLLSDRGEQGPAGSGAAGIITPGDLGFLGWSFDPLLHNAATGSPAAGECSGVLVNLAAGDIIAIQYRVWTAGSGLTAAEVGLIDATTGQRIAVATNQVANMQTAGNHRAAVDGGPVTYGGGLAYVVVLCAGTTMPAFPRCTGDSDILNMTGNGVMRSGRIGGAGGISSIPASVTISASSAGPRGFLFAVEGTVA